MNVMSETLILILVFLGTLFSLFSSLGLIRLPDVYTRSHAATKSTTLGVLFILFGAFLYFLFTEGHVSIRLILGIVFVFLTAPVAGHLICRAAYRSGVQLAEESALDELEPEFVAQDQKNERVERTEQDDQAQQDDQGDHI